MTAEDLEAGDIVRTRRGETEDTFLCLGLLRSPAGLIAQVSRIRPSGSGLVQEIPVNELRHAELELDPHRDAACRLVLTDLTRVANGSLLAGFRANAVFKPYQFRPLLKFLGMAEGRLLLADETGLGKTVEAGYIILEEIARGEGRRVGVLCPARIRSKWRYELWKRFGLSFQILETGRGFASAIAGRSSARFWIASSDLARGYFFSRASTQAVAPLDLLVIDEIHEYIGRSQDTLRRRLGLVLAGQARRIVGISATPIQLELEDLARIMDIVAPGLLNAESFSKEISLIESTAPVWQSLIRPGWGQEVKEQAVGRLARYLASNVVAFPQEVDRLQEVLAGIRALPIDADDQARHELASAGSNCPVLSRHVVRTRGTEVGEDRHREIADERVTLSGDAYVVIQDGERFTVSEHGIFLELDVLFRKAFSLVHRAQLSSCLPAMAGLLAAGERGYATWEAAGEETEDLARSVGHDLTEEDRTAAGRIARRHRALLTDTKLNSLINLMKRLEEESLARKVVVFTHWLPTQRYLSDHLSAFRSFVVRPTASEAQIEDVVRRFRNHNGFAVLLTTDVLREGVDLDAADSLINYDLPFNPQVLEQRIGRIDRVTQDSRNLRVFHIIVRGSLDEVVYQRIHSRIPYFERPLGPMRPITTTTMEELARTGDVMSISAVRAASRRRDESRLRDYGPFEGVESALDMEIQRRHREQSYDPRGYLWLIFWRAFSLLFPQSKVSYLPNDSLVWVEPLPQDAESRIACLSSSREQETVIQSIRAGRRESGDGRWILPPSPEAHVTLLHPLSQVLVRVVERSYGIARSEYGGEVWMLCPTTSSLWKDGESAIAMIRHLRAGPPGMGGDCLWLSLARDGTIDQRLGVTLEDALNLLLHDSPGCRLIPRDEQLRELFLRGATRFGRQARPGALGWAESSSRGEQSGRESSLSEDRGASAGPGTTHGSAGSENPSTIRLFVAVRQEAIPNGVG